MKTEITCKNLFSDAKLAHNQVIEIENGIIQFIGESQKSEKQYDFENLAPALFDLHINGGEEFHFTENPSIETITDIYQSAQKNGVYYVLPTLITSSKETIFKGLKAIKDFQTMYPDAGVLGLHLEGPFLNPIKRGAHLTKYIQQPKLDILKEIIDVGGEQLKLITVAPEMFTDEQLQFLIDSDISVSVGHSNATFEQAQHAFGMGITQVTHLYNAMSAFSHRAPGLIGASLYTADVFTPIILDGVHCSWSAAKIALKNKGDKLFLISDALFQNYKKKSFVWEEFNAQLIDNQYLNSEGNLAGATIALSDAVRNAVHILDIPLAQALHMASGIPIDRIKTNRKIGSIQQGFEAKFVSFDNALERFESKIF